MSNIVESQSTARLATNVRGSRGDTLKRAKLTSTQVEILTGASGREDCLVALDEFSGADKRKTIDDLLQRGLLVEVPGQAERPFWRMDEQGRVHGAAITQAGLAALNGRSVVARRRAAPVEQNRPGEEVVASPARAVSADVPSLSPEPDKRVSKRERIIAMLRRAGGASIGEMMAVTGWLPHTTRAALTGLRQKGYALDRSARPDGAMAYRITAAPTCAGQAA